MRGLSLFSNTNSVKTRLQGFRHVHISSSTFKSHSHFLNFISVNAGNPNSQNHENAKLKRSLIAFKEIVGYKVLTENQNSSKFLSKNVRIVKLIVSQIRELLFSCIHQICCLANYKKITDTAVNKEYSI